MNGLVSDPWGQTSSRRVAGMVLLALLALCVLAAMIGRPIGDHLVDTLAWLTIGCFGLVTTDHFSPTAHKEGTTTVTAVVTGEAGRGA